MSENELSKLRKIIKYVLIKIGFKTSLSGFEYLCEAIEIVVKEPELIHNLYKGVYAKIAAKRNMRIGAIGSSISNLIEYTYINKSFLEINHIFKTDIYSLNDKPFASEIIQLIVEYYNLGLYNDEDFDF